MSSAANFKGLLYVYLCRLLIIFANSLDPDQDQQNVGPDLDPNCLTLMPFLEDFLKVDFEKKHQRAKGHIKLPSRQRVKNVCLLNDLSKAIVFVLSAGICGLYL